MGESVEANLALTARDVDLGHHEMPENIAVRRIPILMLACGVVVFTLQGALGGLRALQLTQIVPLVAFAGFVLLVRLSGPGKRWAAALRPGENEFRYVFDADEIRISSIGSDVRVRYAALHHYIEGKSAL